MKIGELLSSILIALCITGIGLGMFFLLYLTTQSFTQDNYDNNVEFCNNENGFVKPGNRYIGGGVDCYINNGDHLFKYRIESENGRIIKSQR